MHKKIALLLAAIMLLSTVSASLATAEFAQDYSRTAKITAFSADTFGSEVGKENTITYTATVTSKGALKSNDVCVYDDAGSVVTHLRDDGVGADKVANDNIYTGNAVICKKSVKKVSYHAEVGSSVSNEHSVSYYNKITDADWRISDRLWELIRARESKLDNAGMDDAQITDLMFEFLSDYSGVSNVVREDELTVSFDVSNIASVYMRENENEKSSVGTMDYAAILNDLTEKYQINKGDNIDEPTIGVWSPYYGYDSSFSYNYKNTAEAMASAMDYDRVGAYYGAQASVESFKDFDQYGIIMIDSHGSNYGGGGYICIPAPGAYDSTDISEGHIVNSGGTICMTGTFFQKYCETLPNSIVYIGICYGLATTKLSSPLIAHGAAFVSGYDDSVSFVYDGQIMNTFHTMLHTENPSTGDYYTAGEAYTYSINQHGSYDQYSSNRARYINYGNGNVSAVAGSFPVTGAVITPENLTMYQNNTAQLTLSVYPAEAQKYDVEWNTSDANVVTVADGTVTAVGDGTATITCTVSDYALDSANPTIFTATSTINVAGRMPVSGLNVEKKFYDLYTGYNGAQITAEVLPSNASNKQILYSSVDTSVVTVSETGYITPVANGTTTITITTEDGGFIENVICVVKDGGLKIANIDGGNYSFTTENTRSWVPGVVADNLVVMSGNRGQNSTTSVLTMETVTLLAGDRITFSWGVSSEPTYDSLYFYANSTLVTQISGEVGLTAYSYTVPSDGSYTFTWRYSKDSSVSGGSDYGFLRDVDIVRVGQRHTVRFLDMDGVSVLSEQNIEHGQSAVPPTAPQHDGYLFIGWNSDYTQIRHDADILAVYAVDPNYVPSVYYSVSFIDFDGLLIDEQQVKEGESAIAPELPEHRELRFVGWDTDFSCVTSDLVVNAVYQYYGDANCDGYVNTGDATTILRHSVGLSMLTGDNFILGDINHDGVVNTGDAVIILVMAVNG